MSTGYAFEKHFKLVKEAKKDLAQVSVDFLENEKNCSNKDFLERIYQIFLGRDADKEGLDAYLKMLEQEEISKSQIINAFISSGEFIAKHRLSTKC